MSFADVATWLMENEGFRSHFDNVLADSVKDQLGDRFCPERHLTELEHNWQYLLLCASILARSPESVCQDASLRIAQHCLTKADQPDGRKDVAKLLTRKDRGTSLNCYPDAMDAAVSGELNRYF